MNKSALASNSMSALTDEADFLLEGTFVLLRKSDKYWLQAVAATSEADQLHQLRQLLKLPNRTPKRGFQHIDIKRRHPCESADIRIELEGSFGVDFQAGPFRLTAELDTESGDQLKHAKERFGKAPVRRPEVNGRDIVELILGEVAN